MRKWGDITLKNMLQAIQESKIDTGDKKGNRQSGFSYNFQTGMKVNWENYEQIQTKKLMGHKEETCQEYRLKHKRTIAECSLYKAGVHEV